MNGQIPMRIDELGCDYYAGSPHKGMFAPAGCGILWGRPEMLDNLWPTNVTGGWDRKEEARAARFMFVGANNRAILNGLVAAVKFASGMGPDRIYARIHALAKQVRDRAAGLDYLLVRTLADDRLYGSLVAFKMPGVVRVKFGRLCSERKIWVGGGDRMRISAHVHTRPRDIDVCLKRWRRRGRRELSGLAGQASRSPAQCCFYTFSEPRLSRPPGWRLLRRGSPPVRPGRHPQLPGFGHLFARPRPLIQVRRQRRTLPRVDHRRSPKPEEQAEAEVQCLAFRRCQGDL